MISLSAGYLFQLLVYICIPKRTVSSTTLQSFEADLLKENYSKHLRLFVSTIVLQDD
jgi:hypothetical protein